MGSGFRKLGLLLALSLSACGGSGGSGGAPKTAESVDMTPAEANAFIADAQVKGGVKAAPKTDVASVDELMAILESDDVRRFDAAARFLTGKTGVEPQSLHATVELLWTDSNQVGATLTEELGKRARALVEQLEKKQSSGQTLSADETKQLEEARNRQAFLAKAQGALLVLAKDHLNTAGPLVEETVRQFPRDPQAHRVVAYYSLLTGDLDRFDNAMELLKASEATDAGLQYLRAMEANRRFVSRPKTRDYLAKALALKPNLVRAQAKLVLFQENIDDTYAELQKLRALAPDHALVGLVGDAITKSYELDHAFDRAKQPPAPAPPAPAAPTSAAPAATSPAPSTPPTKP